MYQKKTWRGFFNFKREGVMRIFLLFVLLTSISHARDLRLNCKLVYDIDDKRRIEIPAKMNGDRVEFHYEKNNLVTYYIPACGGPAEWHDDGAIKFTAVLDGENLIYSVDFKNYLRDESKLVSVYKETRSYKLDWDEINDAEKHYFDYRDGDVLVSQINKNDWINETGVKIDDCEIYDLDLRKAKLGEDEE